MRNVLMATANVNMGSGASWSFFNLVKYVRASGLNPIVVVVKEGEVYQKLLDESITVYVVEQDIRRTYLGRTKYPFLNRFPMAKMQFLHLITYSTFIM